MRYFENPDYQKILNSKVINDFLEVKFGNGDNVKLPLSNFLPENVAGQRVTEIINNYFEIVVYYNLDKIEIPWDKIRAISDLEFSQYLAKEAEESSKTIGKKIKILREKKQIKSKELAKRTNLTPQTITRIERGHTDPSFSTLQKILRSMGYNLKDLAEYDNNTEFSNEKSYKNLVKKIAQLGIDPSFINKRIIPPNIITEINQRAKEIPELLLNEVASYVNFVFGWEREQVWKDKSLEIKKGAYNLAYFKRPKNLTNNQVFAYANYAYCLAKIVVKASTNVIRKQYPENLNEVKNSLVEQNNVIDLESVLTYIWELGICVLPLSDSGIFHGASWNIDGKHVIVIKNKYYNHARWMFDLLHELYHVFVHLEDDNSSVLELTAMDPFSNQDLVEESEANNFANLILLDSRAEELVQKCIEEAQWKIENLKGLIKRISIAEKVRADVLANYIAFRLTQQNQNWWGTANNFQQTNPSPYIIALEFLQKKISQSNLSQMEKNLLTMAMAEE